MKYLLSLLVLLLAVSAFAQPESGPGWKFILPDDLHQWMQGEKPDLLLINSLSPVEFRDCSIANSISIPLEWMDQPNLLPDDKNKFLVFYCCSKRCAISRRAADLAVQKGYFSVFVLEEGLPAWKEKGYPTVSLERVLPTNVLSLKSKSLLKFMKEREDWFILDIRSRDLYAKQHLRNSMNISFTDLEAHYQDLPLNKKIIVVDEVGHRSFLASRYLKMKGIDDVRRLFGGMEEWIETLGQEFIEADSGSAGK
jgi:rhodanese-related sulfurtransferase